MRQGLRAKDVGLEFRDVGFTQDLGFEGCVGFAVEGLGLGAFCGLDVQSHTLQMSLRPNALYILRTASNPEFQTPKPVRFEVHRSLGEVGKQKKKTSTAQASG